MHSLNVWLLMIACRACCLSVPEVWKEGSSKGVMATRLRRENDFFQGIASFLMIATVQWAVGLLACNRDNTAAQQIVAPLVAVTTPILVVFGVWCIPIWYRNLVNTAVMQDATTARDGITQDSVLRAMGRWEGRNVLCHCWPLRAAAPRMQEDPLPDAERNDASETGNPPIIDL